MDEKAEKRKRQNEALYRAVNERIEEVNETFETVSHEFAINCECADLACAEQIAISRDTYEHARQEPRWFIVRPGHEVTDVEHVVEQTAEYEIVQKEPGEGQRVAEETYPRR